MMKPQKIWIRGSLGALAVWILAAIGIWYAHSQKMTLEKVLNFLSAHALKGQSPSSRLHIVDGLARRVNQLSLEERQRLRLNQDLRQAYEEMTDGERSRYLDQTLPSGMKQMMEAFNKMAPEKRKQLVDNAINNLTKIQNKTSKEDLEKIFSNKNVEKIVAQGLKSYMSDADASAKLDIQPLIEQMQNLMQMAR